MPKKISDNCSTKAYINKFNELKYMTDIPHTISTGNKSIDKAIAKTGTKIIGIVVKDPRAKLALKIGEKAYPYIEKGAANIARARVAYKETCQRKKR